MRLLRAQKTELLYPRDWKATTIEQFIEVVCSYICWHSEKADQNPAWLTQSPRIPGEPRTCGIKKSETFAAPSVRFRSTLPRGSSRPIAERACYLGGQLLGNLRLGRRGQMCLVQHFADTAYDGNY